ncbi:MAG: type I glyceraldehyde-3-phosphate dehydrogenase [Candidatus Spechtbacteria bacterium RIFCSPHIGHO2_02_FULL_43_15b]|uniref:Type I glyceraldehyde-3-phosphate dehydrogenase n=1 Tax=Candidatus Spechtbacteria bacterium RIFCSPHIGHO2_01_FULL_43_30 TaxID=1802158 RepID=A0A1G2H6D7_9BACT|nr:MAG: type I glyceraldehyde-3-phosphate dehydrogenase [Candidatus Spechtbacteria bacterium RIFCSPHIGHO2_01_FULL_43_30]OGZ60458.1 MAG: type I glyceraldehyde-3-phosphate dehydrogenase [Candidatus Spechtbacteria bacterium RIFCSPHIGHO2_02_FULL_43_15b]
MKVAINGFGRIGRTFFRQAFGSGGIEIAGINDLTPVDMLSYLLKYDTVYGRYEKLVETKSEGQKNYLVVDGENVPTFTEKEPEKLPWGDLGVDVVVESTGVFASAEGAGKHIKAGAKYVVISAPAEGETSVPHVLVGTNNEDLKKSNIISNASCTTNCAGPVAAVMSQNPGIEKALLSTVHAYTATQALVDGPNKKADRSRAAAQNIIVTTTGAAEATAKALPELEGIFTGVSIRVPVPAGSIIDFTFVAKRDVTREEINEIFIKASKEERWKGILEVTDEPLVSSDIVKTTAGAIIDLDHTRVVGGNLVKVFAWYDNEWGYSAMLLREVKEIGKLLEN